MLNKKISKISAQLLTGLSGLLWLFGTALAQDGTSLIGHWALDNGAGDAVGAYNGQLIGLGAENLDLPVAVPGKTGQALEFNGGAGVEIPIDLDHRTHSALTVTMWVRLGDTPRAAGTQTLISTGAGDGPRIELARNQVRASAGGRVLGPKYALMPGDWNFVAVSWDHADGSMSMTVNNAHAFYPLGYEAKRSQQTYVSPRDPDLEKYGRKGAQKRYLWIGAKDGFGKQSSLKDVAIDDVRVYSGVLAGDQLVELSGGVSNGTYIPPELQGIASTWAPDIGDRVGEVGVMPKPTGLDQPPDIGDGVDEVGVMPKPTGLSQPPDIGNRAVVINHEEQYSTPDIGDGTAADSGQRIMMGQADSLPSSGELGEVNDLPTSVMPDGSQGTDLSNNASLQLARDEAAPLDITYGSEEEGERAAAAAAALREQQAEEIAPAGEPAEVAPSGFSLALGTTTTVISGYGGESFEAMDFVTEEIVRIDILKGGVALASKPLGVRMWSRSGRQLKIGRGSEEQMIVDLGDTAVVTMKVCRNLSNKRVVGLELDGRKLLENGDFGTYRKDSDKRDSCNNTWGAHAMCPGGAVATGLYVHHKPASMDFGALPDKVIGLQLICRAVEKF